MTLGHLVVRIAHDGRAVHIAGDVPAEGLIEEVVLRRGGQVLAAAHHMGDAHHVVVHDVGKVIGGQPVPLYEHLIVQRAVFDRDVAVDLVVEGGRAFVGDALADDERLAGGGAGVGLLVRKIAAGIVAAAEITAVLLALALLAEAAVGVAARHEQLRILSVEGAPLCLHVGADGAADIRALVVVEPALGQRLVDHVHRALDQTALIGILDAQDEGAARVAGDQPGVERRAQIADVHVSGGRGGEARAYRSSGDARLHLLKPCHVHKNLLSI